MLSGVSDIIGLCCSELPSLSCSLDLPVYCCRSRDSTPDARTSHHQVACSSHAQVVSDIQESSIGTGCVLYFPHLLENPSIWWKKKLPSDSPGSDSKCEWKSTTPKIGYIGRYWLANRYFPLAEKFIRQQHLLDFPSPSNLGDFSKHLVILRSSTLLKDHYDIR